MATGKIHPNLAEVYRRKVEALQEALNEPATKDEAFYLVRSLIEEVRLVPHEGKLRIEIKGELAGILELCDAGSKKPGGTAGLAEQIKMVAGVRNQRYLQGFVSRIPTVSCRFTSATTGRIS